MSKTNHHNDESVVKCPVEGCAYEGVSRGIHLHVMQSSGDGHGENGDVPPQLDFDDLEVVGEKKVSMNYPDQQNIEDAARLCPFCGRAFNGIRGIKIHVGQKAGQGVHPDDATDITKEDCPIAHVDDDMNVIELVEENAIMPSTKRRIESDIDSVSVDRVHEFIDSLRKDGEHEIADRAESELL